MAEQKPTMKLRMVTPERVLFEDEAESVSVNTLLGQITVMPHHIALITVLTPGEIIIRQNGEARPLVVSGGFLEVTDDNIVTILADTAEHVHEVDFERAMKAVELAQKLMKNQQFDLPEYETLRNNLNKHRVRVNAFRKWRK